MKKNTKQKFGRDRAALFLKLMKIFELKIKVEIRSEKAKLQRKAVSRF